MVDYSDTFFSPEVFFMDYIRLTFTGMPEILFSHKHEVSAYDYCFGNIEPFLEITYHDVGELFSEFANGETHSSKEKSLTIGWEKPMVTSSRGKFHRHFTIAVGGQCDTHLLSREEAQRFLKSPGLSPDQYFALLPQEITDKKNAGTGRTLIEGIIFERNQPEYDRLKVNTLLFSLLDLLTSYSRESLLSGPQHLFSDEFYCRKAIEYITENSFQKITVSHIAEKLKLSVGYLSRIFKANTGYTLIEYINTVKINTIRDILANRNASLSELCGIVGIEDEKYLCRLFKKHTSMTVSEFRRMQKNS